ncbi:MAG: hypothetical protein JO291_15925 [Acidimicrobiia bacterium]|nr:hypothetical protein [Acidimicrobiia bacterium]
MSQDDLRRHDADDDEEVRRARRIEVGVYLFTALALIVLGVFFTSKILNWIIGPAFVVAMVTTITPIALRVAGVRDPDAGTRPSRAVRADEERTA